MLHLIVGRSAPEACSPHLLDFPDRVIEMAAGFVASHSLVHWHGLAAPEFIALHLLGILLHNKKLVMPADFPELLVVVDLQITSLATSSV